MLRSGTENSMMSTQSCSDDSLVNILVKQSKACVTQSYYVIMYMIRGSCENSWGHKARNEVGSTLIYITI